MKQASNSPSKDAQRLMFLVDTITEIVWEADLDGEILYANKNWLEFFGEKPGLENSKTWLNFLYSDDVESAQAAWLNSLETGEPFEAEFRLLEASTQEYNWFLSRAMPYHNSEGEIERWYGTFTNIDPSKQNERLVSLNSSKDEFVSLASHQLRTPATGVKQYLGMLLDDMFGEMTEPQKDIVSRAYESNERQLRIISDLLKVAQLDAGEILLHPVTTDISQLVHYIIQDISATFKERSQSLEYRPFKGEALTYIDPETIRMVIENIIENASKYSPENTRVSVSVKKSDQNILIQVADGGVGVDPAHQHMLFERFSRINNSLSIKVGGTGLGLYWSKRVLDLHGGEITYRPNKPQGSVFTVSLPVKYESVINLTEKSPVTLQN
ncbi:hypothetical protein B7Y94_01045 [Candidatus Saccharibacteria bacterium 32-49-12]|nr:MAG: hypothetical protein B7Y94_01045 [Candidatus Saccharibacteria bacterium 32-49-12]